MQAVVFLLCLNEEKRLSAFSSDKTQRNPEPIIGAERVDFLTFNIMSLLDYLGEKPNLNLTVSFDDLKKIVDYCISEVKNELSSEIAKEQSETYLTPDEACKMLGVNRTTLWRWDKVGYFSPSEVGGKRKYKHSEVKNLLEGRA